MSEDIWIIYHKIYGRAKRLSYVCMFIGISDIDTYLLAFETLQFNNNLVFNYILRRRTFMDQSSTNALQFTIMKVETPNVNSNVFLEPCVVVVIISLSTHSRTMMMMTMCVSALSLALSDICTSVYIKIWSNATSNNCRVCHTSYTRKQQKLFMLQTYKFKSRRAMMETKGNQPSKVWYERVWFQTQEIHL